MHEMSLAQNIVNIVEEEMSSHGINKIEAINIITGKLSAIVPDHLSICFKILTENTNLSETLLNIEVIPICYTCFKCKKDFTSEELIFHCIYCNEQNPVIIAGKELTVQSIEVSKK
jgi:hydrogenase nickel incorporation protein HypA/HybF